MVATGEAAGAMAARRLDRHEGRRRSALPTVSVLAGPPGPSSDYLSRWASARHRPMAWLEPEWPRPEEIVVAWVDGLVSGCRLVDEATTWLARRLDRPAESLGPSLLGKTPVELAMFLDAALPSASATGAEAACRWVLARAAERASGQTQGDGLARRLDSALTAYPHPWLRVLVALGELVPPGRQPVLVVACRGSSAQPGSLAWVERAVRLLTDLAIAQPRLELCLVIEPALFRTYLDQAAESRAKALVRESVVHISPGELEAECEREGEGVKAAPGRGAATSRPIADGVPAELLDRFEDVCRAVDALGRETCDPASVDRARSAAERFLFARLESLPETAGLFRLNETLDFRFGPNRGIEVDLAASSLKLAIEIDGYFHFQDPEAYRRDRRKDLELQKHGYLVVRVLAEDVVTALEGVLDTILTAVAFRRGRSEPS
jgi:very-short-patch-repair endonuclease